MTAIPAGTPSGRDLDVGELRQLVARIAAGPDGWLALVRADTAERHFEQLWRDGHVDVWVITWTNGNDTGFHDHDLSSGAVAVVEAEVTEERLVVGGPPLRLHHAAGSTFDFDASHVHRMCLDDGRPADEAMVDRVSELAAARRVALGQIALAWVLHHPGMTWTCPGFVER